MSNRKKRKLTLEQKIIALTALPSKEQSRHMDIGYSKRDLLKARNQLLDAVEQANIARLSGNSQGATQIRKLLLADAKKINKRVEGMKHEKKDFWDRAKDSVGRLINFEKEPIWSSGYKEEEHRDLYADIGVMDIANSAISKVIKINDDVGAWIDPSYKGPANRSYVQEKVLDPVQPTVLDPIERTVLEPAGGVIRDVSDWNQTLPTTIGAKALTRGAAVIANSGYQTIQGLGAQSLENVSNVLHGESYKNYRPGGPQTLGGYEKTLVRTDLGTSIDSGANPLLSGQENWGDGILPDQINSRGGKQQVINANNQFQIYGHAFTPGRALAAVPYEATGRWEALGPESNIYNALSGLTDAAMLIYADPADLGLKGLAAMKRFSRSYDLERGLIEGKGTLNGVLDKPRSEWFKFFNPRTPAEWASSKGGARLIKMIADTDSATEIWRATNGVIPTTGPNGENFLQELAEAKTPEDVQSVLFQAIETGGMEKTAKWKSPGYRLRNLGANSRLFGPPVQNYLANIHPTWVTWDSLEDVLVSFDSFMKSARIPLADTLDEAGEVIVRGRTSILDDLVDNYDSGPNRFNVTEAMLESAKASMKRHIIGNRTLSGDAAEALEKELSELLRFATSQSLEERVYSMTSNYEGLHVDGVAMDFSSHAHVYNDMQSVGVQLPSPREMRKITNYLQTDIVARFSKNSSIRNTIGSSLSGVENVLEVFNRVWKTATLAKLSYPIKLIGETQGRMAAGGFASIFSSPMKAFAWIVGNNKQGTVDRLDDLTKRLQSTKTADELLGEAAEYKQLLARRAHLKEQFGPLSRESQDELETLDAWVELLGGEEAVGASLADIEIQAQTGSFGRAKQNRGRGAQDVMGENFENNQNFEASMNQNNAFYSSSNEASEVTLKNYVVLKNEAASGKRPSYKNSKGEPFTSEEVANELTRELIHLSDPLSRKLLTQGEEATVNWLRNDPQGQKMWAEITLGLKLKPEEADSAEWLASYVRSYVERIEETVGGNTTLKNAIRDGHIKTIDSETGEELYVQLDGSGFQGPSEEGIKAVQEELFDPKTPAPSKIKAEQLVGIGKEDRGAETWRKINGVLYNLYPRQANWYDRSPTYRQAYWRDVVRQAPFMSAAARAEAAAQARNVGLGGSTVSVGRFTFNTGEDLASAIENAPNLTQLAATARLNDEVDNITHVVDEFGEVTSFDTNTGEIVSPGLPGLGDVPTATGTVSPKNQTILDQYDLDLNAYEEAYAAANEDYARRLFQDKTYGPTGSTVDDQNVSEFLDEGAEAMFKDWQQGLIEDSLTAAKPIRMPQAGRAPSRYFSRQQTFERRLTETEVAAFKEEFAERFRKGDLHRRVLEINKDAAPAPYSPSKFLTPDDAEKAKEWDEYTKGPEEYGPPAPPEDGGSPLPPSPPAAPAGSGGAVATPVSFDEGIADQAKESLLADPAPAPERLEPPTLPKKAPGVTKFDWGLKNAATPWPPTLDKEGGQWITNSYSTFLVTDETRPYLKGPLATSENAAATGTGHPPWNVDGVLDAIKKSKNRAALSEGYDVTDQIKSIKDTTAFRVVHDPSKARPGWLDQDWVVVNTDAYSRHYENALAQSGGAEPQISIVQRGDKIGPEHTIVVFEVDGKITSLIMPYRHDTKMVDNFLKGAATGNALTNEVTIARTLETHGYYIVGANYTDDAAGAKSFNFDLPQVNSVLVTHASMTGRPIEIEVADLQVISGNISDADFGAQMDELAEEFPNWDISGPRVSTSERRAKDGTKDGTWNVKFNAPQGFKPQGIQTQVGYSEAHAANIAADVAKARAGEPSRFTPITEMLEDEQVSKMILGDGDPRLDELSEEDLWVRNPDNSDLIFDGDYEGINLIEADMTGRNFEGANLWRADMDSANLRNVNFVNADLYGAVLDSALVKGANFKGANLKNVRFYDVDLTQIKGKSLHNFDLSYSDLSEANMNNMNLSGSDFTQAQMSSTNLTGANLQGSSLGEAYAKNADLHDADLQGADMTRANLQGANMRNTNVEGAYFDGANIDGVDFEGSNITQAQIDSAVLDSDEYVDIEYSDPLDYEGGGRYRGQGPKAGPETVNLGWEDENFASLTDPSFPTSSGKSYDWEDKMALGDYSSPSSDPRTARFNPSRQRAPEPITPLTNDERFEALAQYYAAWVKHGQQRLNKNLDDFEQAVRANVPVPPTRPKSQMPDFDPIENGTLDSLGETDALGDAIKAELAKNYPPAVPRPSRQQVPQLPPARKYSPEEMEKIYEDWFAGPSAAGPPAPPSGGSPPPPPSGPPPSGGALPPDEPAFREGLSMPQVDAAAHRRAAKVVEDLLYNFSNRSVAADKLRLIMPFAEAYREVLTVWARIIKENPSVLRKGQIGYQELMQPSLLGELSGSPEGEGFFYKNPQTGQLMYNIPIVHQLSQALGPAALREIAGAPEGISFPDQAAPAAGLNIVSQTAGPGFGPIPQAAYAIAFLPGVGASLQLYAPDMLKTNDMVQWFQKQIFPFGEPNSMVEVFENMIPRTWIAAAEAWKIDPKEGGAAISSVMRSLMSTGEYKIRSGTPDQQRQEMERLQSDARATTRIILGFGIIAKFATPGGATPRYKGIDNYGRTQYIDSMAKKWRSIKAKHPDDTYAATEEFIEKFGTKNLLMTIDPTTPVKGYLSPTDAAVEWRDKNTIFAERWPDVFGLFGPTKTKPFSYRAFATEKAEGRRENLGIRDQLSLAKTYDGNLQLNRWAEKNDIDLDNPSSSEQAQIADKRAEIVEENFVFEEPTSDYRALPNRIKDLEDIAKGTDADNFKAIVGLRKYLKERSALLEIQIEFGYTGEVVSDSSQFIEERKVLKEWGKYYAYKYPAFKNMWKYLFSKELNGK